MKYSVLVLLGLLLFSCSEPEAGATSTEKSQPAKPANSKNTWWIKAVPIDDQGWGYQLYQGTQMKINQQNIPAISGLHYFESEEKAELAAEFVLQKVEQGIFPPTVEPQELDSIGAINLDSLMQL